ncbi:MAG: hypothetical protein A2Y17_01305 [Clostridiales bacterium GWF2_38_85]|nr:MAG: hypothetical protein A2Y17_01305 [Clostridiales bacterium GWF2_38_85]HBL85157.1 16S rRNA (guanine(527)-N(7))-methyltransferase RsmG [Clostridiales bacterium]
MISKILRKHISLSDEEAKKMDFIADSLVEKNKLLNLTALTEPVDVAMLHFYDSLTVLDGEMLAKTSKKQVIDIGCGAGFPSLPLAVSCPESHFTLLDSTAKKLSFAEEMKSALGLNITTLAARAEEVSHKAEYREQFDIATARGVARLNILCEWALPFVKVGGVFVAMKGSNGKAEADEAENAVKTLGGRIVAIKSVEIPLSEHTHTLIYIKKEHPTSKEYPRENRKIQKKPL